MSTPVKISLPTLTEQVESGMKKDELAKFYGLSMMQMTKALKAAGLTIRKFHNPKFELVTEEAVEDINATEVVEAAEVVENNDAVAETAVVTEETTTEETVVEEATEVAEEVAEEEHTPSTSSVWED